MENLTDAIIAFESGELNDNQIIDLFAKLVGNGMAWSLQGMYGRAAMSLMREGYISKDGEVLKYPE